MTTLASEDGSPVCPVDACLGLIASKYKPLILWKLHHAGPLRFGELVRTLPRASKKMITQTLRELESDALVHRRVFGSSPPWRTEYALSERGTSMVPVLEACASWARRDSSLRAPGP